MKTTYQRIFSRSMVANGEGQPHVIGASHPAEVFNEEFDSKRAFGEDREIFVLTAKFLYLLDDTTHGAAFVRVIDRERPATHPFTVLMPPRASWAPRVTR